MVADDKTKSEHKIFSYVISATVISTLSLRNQVEVSIKDREKHIVCFPKWSWEIPRILASRGGACESKKLRKNARRRFSERKPELSCTPWSYLIKSKSFDTHDCVNRTGITLGLFSQPPIHWKIVRRKIDRLHSHCRQNNDLTYSTLASISKWNIQIIICKLFKRCFSQYFTQLHSQKG